ncbi:MAG: DHH family phosphoesterase, partial [Lutibacter sp.]
MKAEKIKEIKKLLATPKNIVIVPHRNPDGDAIGSSLALYNYLRNNHYVTVVAPNDYPDFLKWMPFSDDVKLFDKQNKQSKKALEGASIVFLLDFNALHRIGEDMQKTVEQFKGTFIMIDHHQQPDTSITDYIYSDASICSTCQMVYHFLEMLDDVNKIDADIASCLYAGIVTDTGSFRFPSTTS